MKQSRFLRILLVVVLIPLLLIQFVGVVQNASAGGDPAWSANVNVSEDTTHSAGQASPTLAADGIGNVYVAWVEIYSRPGGIYFARSTDQGKIWSAKTKVDDNTGWHEQNWPNIAVDGGGNLYLVWGDTRDGKYSIYFAKSTDGGATWSADIKISDQTSDADACPPSLAVDVSGNLFVVWNDNRNSGNWDVYFSKSMDGGANWSPSVRINDVAGTNRHGSQRVIVDNSGYLYAVWDDGRDEPYDPYNDHPHNIYSSTSVDGGVTWSGNVRVNDQIGSVGPSGPPGLTVDTSGNLYAIWVDTRDAAPYTGYSRVYFSKSTDGGAHWSANVRVGDNPTNSWEAYTVGFVIDTDGNLYATWADNRVDPPGISWDYDVYFAKSTDGGDNWSPSSQVNDDTTSSPQYQTALAMDGNGNLYAAWQDFRNGYFEIYSSQYIVETNQPPLADAGGPYTADWGMTFTLDGSGSADPDGNIAFYEWDLDNDGEYDDATGVTITTSFSQIGNHIIGLRVTDDGGLRDTDTAIVTVLPWTLKGFYQPVDMNGVFNIAKNGSTIPFKFEVFAGGTELTDTAYIKSLTYGLTACEVDAPTDAIELTATGGTSLRYDPIAGQFIFNWKTPSAAGKCYRVTLMTIDGSTLVAYFKLK